MPAMTNPEQSATVPVPSEDDIAALNHAGEVALTFLRETDQSNRNQAVRIFEHMAGLAAKRISGEAHIEFETRQLKAIVAPGSQKEASGWMSPLWRQLEELQNQWQQGLKSTALELRHQHVPKLIRIQGTTTRYRFVSEAIDHVDCGPQQAQIPDGGLRYTAATVSAPGALVLAGLRGGVVRATMPFIVGVVSLATLMLILLVFGGWLLLTAGLRWNAPITTTHISIAAIWVIAVWAGRRAFLFLDELGDLGIVMAPEFLVPFKDDHVTLELRPRDAGTRGAFAFVRYTGTCPICSGRVLLHDGKKEFVGRIVGRCGTSPREHVFSFDQKLLVGRPLRN